MSENMLNAAKQIAIEKRGRFPLMKFKDFDEFFRLIRAEANRHKIQNQQ